MSSDLTRYVVKEASLMYKERVEDSMSSGSVLGRVLEILGNKIFFNLRLAIMLVVAVSSPYIVNA